MLCNTNRNRAKILDKLGMTVPLRGSPTLFSVEASSHVLDLASQLIPNFSTLVETTTCTQNCLKKNSKRKLKSVRLLDERVKSDLYDVSDIFSFENVCSTTKCGGSRTKMVTKIGKLLWLLVCNKPK